MSLFTTKVTSLANGFGCRVFYNDVLIVEALAPTKDMIGPTFRDLFRTMDKMGGDEYTKSVRERNSKEGNMCAQVKHKWHHNPGIFS